MIVTQEDALKMDASRFQAELAEFVTTEKQFPIMVETGVSWGVSTAQILSKIKPGQQLYSVDPAPNYQHEHPQWHFYKEMSDVALPKIYDETGPWDFFLHDSDHYVYCQTFEYELAWHLVKDGGFIATDDSTWGGHYAWAKFLTRHQVHNVRYFGHAACVVREPGERLAPKNAFTFSMELAEKALKDWNTQNPDKAVTTTQGLF